jgi:alkylhydroperoxidase family enzyme
VPRPCAFRPELAKWQLPIQTRYHDRNYLDERLLELVRLRIAPLNDSRTCKTARKSDAVSEDDIACLSSNDERFSESERLALRFAEVFVIDHKRIDDGWSDDERPDGQRSLVADEGRLVEVGGVGRLL